LSRVVVVVVVVPGRLGEVWGWDVEVVEGRVDGRPMMDCREGTGREAVVVVGRLVDPEVAAVATDARVVGLLPTPS